ncbi:MAG: 30S ribosomal protein S3 [Candidatus Omnitrophota bacterium]|nr:30S ribosomal protein S3 [Candidatus Omnitrophota bacterium]
MGQKVSPLALRIGFIQKWQSNWFAHKKDFGNYIQEDQKIRNYIKTKFAQAAIARIVIDRVANQLRVRIASARPGIIIGRHGADIDRLREDLKNITDRELAIDIEEIKNPAMEAQLVAENISYQLLKRIAFRRAIKRAIEQSMTAGAKGIKVVCSGRLGGAEMSRQESYKQGKLPLSTFRADIDYGFAEAQTTYGKIGVKTWIYKGDVILEKKRRPAAAQLPEKKE